MRARGSSSFTPPSVGISGRAVTMANRGEHQRGYQREPQRAEADPAVLGQVGSRFDSPWSHGGPTYMSAPLLNAAHQYIGPTFVEQSLEQIVDGFDHHPVPPLRFRNGTPGSPPRTIDPQRLLRQRQVPSLQGHDMVGAQHSRALPNASIATAQSTLQARARASKAGRAPQQQRGGADFQTAAWPSYPVDANVAAIRGQYQQTQSIDSTVATASAILEGARTVRSFICDVCGRKCKDQQALRHHLSNVHDPTKKYKFKCPNSS
nr:hypothetical protein B0A51_10266 [Rachicladosporium sp. CCFEE 5018]